MDALTRSKYLIHSTPAHHIMSYHLIPVAWGIKLVGTLGYVYLVSRILFSSDSYRNQKEICKKKNVPSIYIHIIDNYFVK